MKKGFLLLMAMLATSAYAQQNVDITAEQFNSGAADSILTSLGSEAEISGKRLIVTAPPHWHAQIAARIRAGGNADMVIKDGFYETLLVRVEDKAPEPAKPEPKPAAVAEAPAPAPAPAAVEIQPEPPKVVEALPAPVQPVVETPPPAPAPVAETPAPVAEPPAAEPAPAIVEESAESEESQAIATVDPKAAIMLEADEPGDTNPVREAMERRYNEGKRILKQIEPNKLERGDVMYTGKDAAVIVRRQGGRLERMWLVGSLNLNQLAFGADGVNKYRVLSSVIQ